MNKILIKIKKDKSKKYRPQYLGVSRYYLADSIDSLIPPPFLSPYLMVEVTTNIKDEAGVSESKSEAK
jgi:hypothetical protein